MRSLPVLAVLLVAVLPGCQMLNFGSKPEAAAPKLKTKPAVAVHASQITPENARIKAQQLNEELDGDLDGNADPEG